jgi:hypothetical protein
MPTVFGRLFGGEATGFVTVFVIILAVRGLKGLVVVVVVEVVVGLVVVEVVVEVVVGAAVGVGAATGADVAGTTFMGVVFVSLPRVHLTVYMPGLFGAYQPHTSGARQSILYWDVPVGSTNDHTNWPPGVPGVTLDATLK